ncbi:cyanophycinase [Longimicrobium sp.]|uniref:cyanophycinase n=1 Tax=Longimicrobium sp. TaxID=2029185 RepID=UPI002E2ED4E7|nr:cyanophycinase [Longimicrobium sp.]HEX6041714.1 cyanophycinase [Longimicrobium sp.]
MSDELTRGIEGQMRTERNEPPERGGRLLVIGGAEDPDPDDMTVLPHLVQMAGGKNARIIICSSPSENPEEKVDTYGELFEKIGVAEVIPAPITGRHEAEQPDLVDAVRRATAVFFTGGDQLRLTALIAGTEFCETIRSRLYGDGLVVAGTSAGAAAMSSVMIIGGTNEGTVRREDVSLAPGLGYWRDTVVDTHFNQRGRVSRLLTIFAHNPQVLGIGIDENTAIDLVPGDRFTVLGAGAVMVFNGRVTHTNAPDASDDQTLAITDSVLHTLPSGYGFNLRTKRPILPDGEEIPPAPPH